MKTGVELIAAERERQVNEEGYIAENDDGWKSGELNDAGIGYAQAAAYQARGESLEWIQAAVTTGQIRWPWEDQWWNPQTQVQNLVKAGALIAAEIDRLNRLPARKSPNKQL